LTVYFEVQASYCFIVVVVDPGDKVSLHIVVTGVNIAGVVVINDELIASVMKSKKILDKV
jgi:hypothetical protein